MLPYTTNPKPGLDKSKYVYDLSSAVVHKGKLDAGHYYVYCRQGNEVCFLSPTCVPATFKSWAVANMIKWILFNDDQVTPVTEAEVLNADAYLLFYSLRSLATSSSQ
jgi:ubiquitin carboxyl-terminal hydrolase 22/27/51